MNAPERVWRVFPWDPDADEGSPFSPGHVPGRQGAGRFDLPGRASGVLYAAETAEHAVGECIQHLRGQRLEDADLMAAGRRLALVSLALSDRVREGIVDLCNPRVLVRLRVRPDETASRERKTTQRIASHVYARGETGLRWWSAFFGDWHTIVLFRDRIDRGGIGYGEPEPLSLRHPALRAAAAALGLVAARA